MTQTTKRKGLDAIEVRGIWIRNKGCDQVEVLAEIGNEWRLLATETIGDGVVSNIIEPNGIATSPRATP